MEDDIFVFRWIAQDGSDKNVVGGMGTQPVEKIPPPLPCRTGVAERPAGPLGEQARRLAGVILRNVPAEDKQAMAVFLGTMMGAWEEDRIFQRSRKSGAGKYCSPAAFSRTLPSTVAAELAIEFGMQGPLLVFTAGAASGPLAMIRATRWIQSGNISLALAGALDWSYPGIRRRMTGAISNDSRTLLCLIGRRSALPRIHPVIQIKQGRLKYSPDENSHSMDTSIAPLADAFRRACAQRVHIQGKSGIGTVCQMILEPV